MLALGATELQCQQAAAAGDLNFYKASGCDGNAANDALIAQKKKSINTQLYVLISVAVLATGIVIYFSTKKS